jgi:hypothetical protein
MPVAISPAIISLIFLWNIVVYFKIANIVKWIENILQNYFMKKIFIFALGFRITVIQKLEKT